MLTSAPIQSDPISTTKFAQININITQNIIKLQVSDLDSENELQFNVSKR